MIGSFVYDRDEVETALALAGRGQVKPLVDSTFPLDGLADAFHRLESRQALRQSRRHALSGEGGEHSA